MNAESQELLAEQAEILKGQGNPKGAERLERTAEQLGQLAGVPPTGPPGPSDDALNEKLAADQRAFAEEAEILRGQGDPEGADRIERTAERIGELTGVPPAELPGPSEEAINEKLAEDQRAFAEEAELLRDQGNPEGAETLERSADAIADVTGRTPMDRWEDSQNPVNIDSQDRLAEQAEIVRGQGDPEGAERLERTAEDLAEVTGVPPAEPPGPSEEAVNEKLAEDQRAFADEAELLRDQGDLEGAETLERTAEAIADMTGVPTDPRTDAPRDTPQEDEEADRPDETDDDDAAELARVDATTDERRPDDPPAVVPAPPDRGDRPPDAEYVAGRVEELKTRAPDGPLGDDARRKLDEIASDTEFYEPDGSRMSDSDRDALKAEFLDRLDAVLSDPEFQQRPVDQRYEDVTDAMREVMTRDASRDDPLFSRRGRELSGNELDGLMLERVVNGDTITAFLSMGPLDRDQATTMLRGLDIEPAEIKVMLDNLERRIASQRVSSPTATPFWGIGAPLPGSYEEVLDAHALEGKEYRTGVVQITVRGSDLGRAGVPVVKPTSLDLAIHHEGALAPADSKYGRTRPPSGRPGQDEVITGPVPLELLTILRPARGPGGAQSPPPT